MVMSQTPGLDPDNPTASATGRPAEAPRGSRRGLALPIVVAAVALVALLALTGRLRPGDQGLGATTAGVANTPATAVAVATSARTAGTTPDSTQPPTPGRHRSGGVAALLAQPPPAMTTVELDAYHGEGYMGWPGRGRVESMTGCPSLDSSPLTDHPLWQTIHFGGQWTSNHPPPDAPWLIAGGIAPKDLPRFGRLRGHLGDPEFAHCKDADRIFVVESVAAVYEPRRPEQLPTPDSAEWTAFDVPSGGARLHYPSAWTVTATGDDTWALTSPDLPAYPLQLQVLRTDAVPAATQTAVAEHRQSVPFPQRESALRRAANVPRLWGDTIFRNSDPDHFFEVRFAQAGMSYVFRQEYGAGFDYDPRTLAYAQDILDTFEITGRPTITPIPPPKTSLGPGPFWSREQAEQLALEMIEGAIVLPAGAWHVTDGELVPEAEALARGDCDMRREPDNMWYTYPDGVWLLELTAATADRTLVYYTYLDATSGFHLCTAARTAVTNQAP